MIRKEEKWDGEASWLSLNGGEEAWVSFKDEI